MKKLIWILILFSLQAFAQNDIHELINTSRDISSYEMFTIFDLNVFRYFHLENEYSTELKKSVFKESEEYKQLLSELNLIKSEAMNSIFYKKIESFGHYDVQKKAFVIELGEFYGFITLEARAPKTIDSIYFKTLPTKILTNIYNRPAEFLFLNVDEESALEIENGKNVNIYLFYSPSGKEKVRFKFTDYEGKVYNLNETHIKAPKVRIVFYDQDLGKVYSDKTY